MRLWTIGHSTRSLNELVGLLKAHGIKQVVDVRRYPGSRRFPHFGKSALSAGLSRRAIGYVWLGESLGGRRRPDAAAEPHSALRSAAFRGYAAHMETPEFRSGMKRLLGLAGRAPTAFLCAEALWWRCHRSMIADWLTARGHEALHVLSKAPAKPHRLRPQARVARGRLVYDVRSETAVNKVFQPRRIRRIRPRLKRIYNSGHDHRQEASRAASSRGGTRARRPRAQAVPARHRP